MGSRVILLTLTFLFHLGRVGQMKEMKRGVNQDTDRDAEKGNYKEITHTQDQFLFLERDKMF